MYKRQPFGPGGADIPTFTLLFRAEQISDPALVSATQWSGEETPIPLNMTESLDHSNQSREYSMKQVG
jgi:hypothetical protein